jgi:inhibitor of KinA sporulation pathway (predicted exonuclease)
MGLLKELELAGLSFEGTNHNGSDDAYNAAKLLYKILKK